MRGGVICCGNAVMDILVRTVDRMAWNTTTWVHEIEQHMGGNGASTAYALAKLGTPVRLLTVLGSDAFGDALFEHLRSVGVDVSLISRVEAPTATTVGLVNSAGDRLFLHRVGAGEGAFAEPLNFDAALTDGMSHFHLANLFSLPGLRRHACEILQRARAVGLTTSVDTGWDAKGRWIEDLGSSLPYTDLLFVNEDEAQRLGGAPDAAQAAAHLRSLGACTVVVKLGARGCAVFSDEGSLHAAAFDVAVVDTTGAGDCFAGAFLAALHHGLPHGEAARVANGAAGLSVQHLGATGGLRSWDETRAWMETARIRSI